MPRRKLLAVPEGQLTHSAVAYSPTSNNLQLTESAAPTDSTSSSLLQQLSSLQPLASSAGSSSHQAPGDAFPPRQPHSAEQRSSSLSSVTTEVSQSQTVEATRSSEAAPALQAPGAMPAAAAHPRLTPAQPRVIQLGPIFQPMLAAMQTNPSIFASASAIAHSSRQSPHPDQGSAALHPKAHPAMQQLLTAAEAIGYCQGIRQRASQADNLQKLMFHREGVDPLSGSDLAVRPPRVSQPEEQQPDEASSAHHQAVAAADSQTAPQHQLSTSQHAAPQPLSALSKSSSGPPMPMSSQQAHSHQPQEAPCKTGLPSSGRASPSVCGSKHAHEASDAHMQVSSSKRRRLVEVAQLRDPPPHQSPGGNVIKFRCNIADILDVHCGPFNDKSTSAEFGPPRSSSIRAGPSRAPTMPLASLPDATGTTCLPAMPASSTLRSTASISATPSLPPSSQGLSRRAKTAAQQPTAGSVAGAVASAQGTDWALAAHAAALSSSWRSCLPNLVPQQGTVSQASQAHMLGAQTGVLLQPNYMLASFPHIVNQLMMQPRSDLMPTWVAGHQPPAHQLGSNDAGMRSGQEEPPPSKRLCQGGENQHAAAAAASSLHPLAGRQLPQLTSIQLLKQRARQHMANAGATPLPSQPVPSSFQIPIGAGTHERNVSHKPVDGGRTGHPTEASSAQEHTHAAVTGLQRPRAERASDAALPVLPQHQSALQQLSALSMAAPVQIDLTDSSTAMDASGPDC